jgi:ribosomal protein S18 acetylase RimI-like enzyme
MEIITTRTATIADLDILLDFEQGVIQSERPFDPTIMKDHIHYYDIAGMIKAENIEVVVAELNGEVIGSGYARIEPASKIFFKHKMHAYLGFMYVKPEHRGKGVNKKVIATLQQWAIEKGINEFRLDVYHDNLPAIAAYEKVGFSKLMIEMRMGVPAEKP